MADFFKIKYIFNGRFLFIYKKKIKNNCLRKIKRFKIFFISIKINLLFIALWRKKKMKQQIKYLAINYLLTILLYCEL